MEEYLLLGLVGVFFGGLTMMTYLALVRRRERVESRLEAMPSSDPTIGSTPELVLGDLTPAFSGQLPMTEEGKTELQRDLRTAGLYRPTALMEYAAVRAVLTILPLIGGAVVTLIWTTTVAEATRVWIGAIVISLLGFSLPRIYLYFKGRSRREAVERGLPTAIDMLTLCLSAGLNVLNSLQRVSDELSTAHPELCEELQIVRRQSDLRSLEFALAQFADRVDLPQLRNVSVILSQSEKLGADGISVLREFADNLRYGMRQAAEAHANRAPLKMLAPGYLIGIGMFILIITPPLMEIAEFRKDNILTDIRSDAQKGLKELEGTPPTPPAPESQP